MAANEIGQALAEVKERTGWTWETVGEHLGISPVYARKLAGGAGKFGKPGAGRAYASRIADFQRTGLPQKPYQRAQRVRAKGGGSRPATPRPAAPARRPAFFVSRSVFKGTTRDGWAVNIGVPARKTAAGDREDARNAIMGTMRSAAQGRRRVSFRVTLRDGRVIEIGAKGGYSASSALAGSKAEGNDPLEWLALQSQGNASAGGSYGEFEASEIREVEVIALP